MEIEITRKPKADVENEIKIVTSDDVYKLNAVQNIKDGIQEHLLLLGLDRGNNLRNVKLVGIGSSDNISINSKDILKITLMSANDKVILVHNHPSNNLEPSKDDLHITDVTNEMLKVFNIQLQDHIIVTEKEFISMNKIQKIGKERNIKSINTLQKGLLIEENERLKQQINELQKEIGKNNSLEVISAEYVGNYNDTTVYNVELSLNSRKEYVTLEKKYNDRDASHKWEVFSNLALKDEEMDYIIQVVSKNPPTMSIDAPPTIYSQEIGDSVEETITSISKLDNKNFFTVARVMENGKCVELHYNEGKAHIEYGTKEAEDLWKNEINEDVKWFNLNLTDDKVLEYLNKEFDEHFLVKDADLDIDY